MSIPRIPAAARAAFNFALPLALGLLASGCSLFIGNVKPVDEKSDDYSIMDLSRFNPDWTRLPTEKDPARTDITDLGYRSQMSGAIVSLNSGCRASRDTTQPLEELSRQLLLGIDDIEGREDKTYSLSGQPALETTLQGRMNSKLVKLRTIVVKKDGCVFDLMYLARPDRFAEKESDFSRFAQSLRLN